MIIEIKPNGSIFKYPFNRDRLNFIIAKKIASLNKDSYKAIIEEVSLENLYHPKYRSVFTGTTMQIPLEELVSERIGGIEDYSYYESIYLTEDYNVLNSLRMRLDHNGEFSYLIPDIQERLPYYLIKKLKEITKTS